MSNAYLIPLILIISCHASENIADSHQLNMLKNKHAHLVAELIMAEKEKNEEEQILLKQALAHSCNTIKQFMKTTQKK